MTPETRLNALGSLSLVAGGESLLAGRRKLLCLLTWLVRREGRPADRLKLASLFWPEADESRARQSLRQALVELRVVLGEWLEVNDREVRVLPGSVMLDATLFEQLMDDGNLREAVTHWAGDFLAGAELTSGEELRGWLEGERMRLRKRRAWLGEALVKEAESRGAWPEALAHAELWLAHLPDDPDAQARLDALRTLAGSRGGTHPGGMALLTPDLVAREADFAILTGLWERVQRGSPGLALIEGEDGSGKSRLLEEFLRWARRRDDRIVLLRARAFEAEQDRSLLLARHLFAPLASAPGVAGAPAATLRAMAAMAPEFGERYPALPPGKADDLQESVARVLAEAATETRIVVAVDDVHLADRPSRELLEALFRRPVGGVLIILTSAPDVLGLRDLERRPAAAGQLLRVRLGALDRDDLERALASMAEFRPPDRAALAGRLLAETGGNPLAAVELTTLLADRGIIAPAADGSWVARLPPPGVPLPLPTSFSETMAARLRELPPNPLRTLQVAAVLARSADTELLQALTGLSSQDLDAALTELLARRLLRAGPNGGGQVEFTHEALRRTVYEGLSPVRRGELHAAALALLRRGSRSSSATAALAYHQEHASARAPARSRIIIGAAAVVLLGTGLAWASRRYSHPAGPDRLAIAPPAGDADSTRRDLERLAGEALSLSLGHAQSLLLVDPSTDQVSGSAAPATLILETRAEVSGGGLHLSGVVRRARADHEIVAQTAVDGQLDALPELAARLAGRLFPDQLGAMPFELSAARSTSVPALQSYFVGLRLARHADMEAAAQAFWQATRRDPSLAAAWHALARINAWYFLSDRAARMADSAAAHSRGLLAHELLLLQGWQEFAHGRADAAEAHFRQVLGIARGNLEATIGLAEVLQHHNWFRGRSPGEAEPFWEQAARSDPTDWRPHVHLWELAASQGHRDRARQWLARAVEFERDTSAATRLLVAQLAGDTASLLRRIGSLPSDNEWGLMQLAVQEGTVLDRVDLADACVRRLTEPGHAAEVQGFGWEQLAHLALARGKWEDATAALRRARALEPVSAATLEATLWAAPFLPAALADSGRRAMRNRLRQAPTQAVKRTFLFWFDLERAREPLLRVYLERLLALQSGETGVSPEFPAALRAQDSLAELAVPLAASLGAWRTPSRDTASVLAGLEQTWDGSEAGNMQLSAFWARPWDQYRRARLLEGSRPELAAALYRDGPAVSLATLPYTAPSALREGALHERAGQTAEAIRAYRRVVALWSDADPVFRPGLDSARARLTALGGGPP